MNLRHTAALALVGWYLMVPPAIGPDLPIAKWTHTASYDTAAECEKGRVEALAHFKESNPPLPPHITREEAVNSLISSECIATDDPRLK